MNNQIPYDEYPNSSSKRRIIVDINENIENIIQKVYVLFRENKIEIYRDKLEVEFEEFVAVRENPLFDPNQFKRAKVLYDSKELDMTSLLYMKYAIGNCYCTQLYYKRDGEERELYNTFKNKIYTIFAIDLI